mmetsp:Transcript_39992/g.58805  ORF Transcript_39992/g.58805 Transcript_39992/m.58805 type:complete len:262 (-) Transcript_39992:586-1371(-)
MSSGLRFLARLLHLDTDPLARKERFPIEDAAHRGITLRQLLDVRYIIYQRCKAEDWKRSNPQDTEKPLKPQDVTFYDLFENFIKPVNLSNDCSYVELIASKPQRPQWFVSHWWGESVLDFTKCIQRHARDRKLGLDTVYWVCAFANNHHREEEEVGADLKETSFYKAMECAKGILSILDSRAVCYTRIWCGYELYLSFVGFSKKYDVYSVAKDEFDNVIGVVRLTHVPSNVGGGFFFLGPNLSTKTFPNIVMYQRSRCEFG